MRQLKDYLTLYGWKRDFQETHIDLLIGFTYLLSLGEKLVGLPYRERYQPGTRKLSGKGLREDLVRYRELVRSHPVRAPPLTLERIEELTGRTPSEQTFPQR